MSTLVNSTRLVAATAAELTRTLLDGPGDLVAEVAGRPVNLPRFRTEVEQLADLLRAQDVRPGDVVSIRMQNSLTLVRTVLALWANDAHVVLVDPTICPPAGRSLLRDAGSGLHIRSSGCGVILNRFAAECDVIVTRRPGAIPSAAPMALSRFSAGRSRGPRLVGRSVASIADEISRVIERPMVAPGERIAVLDRVDHPLWFTGVVLAAMAIGATLVFPDGRLPARADVVVGAPHTFSGSAPLPRPERLELSGGAPLAASTRTTVLERWGIPLGNVYGTAETGIAIADLDGLRTRTDIGVPLPGVDVVRSARRLRLRIHGLTADTASTHVLAGDLLVTGDPIDLVPEERT